ncbi:hypothetical protein QUF56_09280 [Ureibacillus composti]|nr:hypothetical protein [Ureibacillus composti]
MSKYVLFTQDEHETIDFSFSKTKVEKFIELWNEGYSIVIIARKLQRKQIEVTMLAMDLDIVGKIHPRPGGIFGTIKKEAS